MSSLSGSTGNATDDVRRMIRREQEIMDAARRMRVSARNKSVRSQCDSQISEAARNISYLQEQLNKLSVDRSGGSRGSGDDAADPTGSGSRGGASSGSGSGSASSAAGSNTQVAKTTSKARSGGKITRLDLFRWDKPATMGPRIRLMLQQLEYKTSIEQQYERGTQKMIELYRQTGDRKSQAEAHANLAESRGKMALLKRSKKRYSDLNLAAVLGSADDDSDTFDFGFAPNVRKPLTGLLRVVVKQVEEVDHTIAWADQVEMWVTMKVENNSAASARTRTTRSSQFDEDFTIAVDKGNEVEFTVYDRSVTSAPSGSSNSSSAATGGTGQANPVALLWLRISDIAEAIRQKRVEREFQQTGWASADQVQAQQEGTGGSPLRSASPRRPGDTSVGAGGANTSTGVLGSAGAGGSAGSLSAGESSALTSTGPNSSSSDGDIEGWFTLEPAGRVYLKLGFEKTGANPRKRARVYDSSTDLARLGRHNAIRKREETQQVHGHEFVLLQAYNIVKCSVCGDFTTSYFQCQECQLTCDRKCFSKIVTKCTALMSEDPDEAELNHRIPHHFEPTSNMRATWCAQCGFILPLASRKNVRKCTECAIMVHSSCSKYVPDLCGMSMEMAAQVVNEINSTRIRQATKAAAGTYSYGGQGNKAHHVHSHSHTPSHAHTLSHGAHGGPGHPHSVPRVGGSGDAAKDAAYRVAKPLPKQPGQGAYGQPSQSLTSMPSQIRTPGPVKRKQVPSASPGSMAADARLTDPRLTDPRSGYPDARTPAKPDALSAKSAAASWTTSSPASADRTRPSSDFADERVEHAVASTQMPEIPTQSPERKSKFITQPIEMSQPGDLLQKSPQKQAYVPNQTYVPSRSEERLSATLMNSIPKSSSEQSLHKAAQAQAAQLLAGVGRPGETAAEAAADEAAAMDTVDAASSGRTASVEPVTAPGVTASSSAAPGTAVAGPIVAAPPAAAARPRRRRKVGLDDFSFLAVLGKGNFGKVMLAESKHSGNLYAVKVLKKNFIIDNREVESTRSEKRVFLIANRERHPFLINLSACFQTENRIYFVMDYVSGGDLMFHIQQKMFSAKRAQFYAAEVLLALKHFHDNDVIYRDLKLDNILLSLGGHVKIADYGLCKENMGPGQTTGTFCGTPDFIAPEILLDQKYGRSVDWWALGVLMYQMLLGKSPFHGNDEDEVYDAILSDEPLYPIHMPRDSVSILQQLLTRDPSKRLGSGPRGAEEIMEHPYFSNINFDDLLALKIEPPFKPEVDFPTDVRYFEKDFTSEMPALTPMNSTLTPAMQEEFRGFSYSLGDSI